MELDARNKSLRESASLIRKQQMVLVFLAGALIILSYIIFNQTKIVILETPGMPANSVIQKTSMDKGAQRAVLVAVTNNLAQINPANIEYQKAFLQAFLAPAVYTKISMEMDTQIKRLIDQRELGSYYFVLKSTEYDPKIDTHFILGDVHTVNAAKDTAEPYVFEYVMHVENYRPVIDSVTSYPGTRPHNSAWKEGQKK